jgi:ribosomal protein S18 acetylase RimI-like enzyme
VLDNPVWHALTGPQATVAEGTERAKRYDTEVAPFAGLPDEVEPSDWAALAGLVGPSGWACLFRREFDDPGWERPMAFPTVQMLGDEVDPDEADGAVVLGGADVPEMLDLTERTQPGPFAVRTHELGIYVGIRDGDGRLVAMAGERMRLDGVSEISAVCTDETARGRGHGEALVRDLVRRIKGRGELPVLHVVVENPARRLYERLGFTERMHFEVTVLQAPPA